MLITEEYRELQRKLHEDDSYGVASVAYAPLVKIALAASNAKTVLDYGCGKGRLAKALGMGIWQYDPAIPEFAARPKPADFVACIDVLEHVEPQCLTAVLDDLKRVTLDVGFFTIATGPARKVLADGRNAHLIIQPMRWWLPLLEARFDVRNVISMTNGAFLVIVRKKNGR